jgi:anti-sigma-K factor RskA
MAEHDDLTALAALVKGAAPPFEVPVGLEERVFAAIAPARRRRRSRRLFTPLAAAGATAAIVLVVAFAGRDEALEHYALRGGDARVSAAVQTTGVGREVTIEIDRLRDPRPDGLYELWFVARDDPRGRPHRVSAGTFHPDDSGRGSVRLVGAADPKAYPRISVTLEPADGNPRRQGPTVLTAVPVD